MREKLIVLEETDSTNTVAKSLARQGAPDGTAVLARRQTGGRGRLGRSFFSPEGGVYLSVLYRPELKPEELPSMTVMAAVAVRRGIRALCGVEAEIKWTNDLQVHGKKLCGILCEGVFTGEKPAIVMGIGVNVCAQSFPADISAIVTTLEDEAGRKLEPQTVAEAILASLDACVAAWPACRGEVMAEYREACSTLGREITWQQDGGIHAGIAQTVDEAGGLVVETGDGTVTLRFGEVSVRGTENTLIAQ